jgi:hypothetical protein
MNRVTDEVIGELREELDEKDKIIMALSFFAGIEEQSGIVSKNASWTWSRTL